LIYVFITLNTDLADFLDNYAVKSFATRVITVAEIKEELIFTKLLKQEVLV
jgi:hypothetical protein